MIDSVRLRIPRSSCNFFLLTFTVIAEAHFSLSETNCVFSLANAIELFQLSLVNAL